MFMRGRGRKAGGMRWGTKFWREEGGKFLGGGIRPNLPTRKKKTLAVAEEKLVARKISEKTK